MKEGSGQKCQGAGMRTLVSSMTAHINRVFRVASLRASSVSCCSKTVGILRSPASDAGTQKTVLSGIAYTK